MKVVDTGHIVIEPDVLGGEPHIAGHHIAVSDAATWSTHHSLSPEEIAHRFHLTLDEVHAALAYYYDHKDEIDRASAETETMETLAGQIRYYEPIPHGIFSDD